MIKPDLDRFLGPVLAWAASDPRVAAMALVGSHARGTPDADSDVDLLILCSSPDDLLQDTRWIESFGPVGDCSTEPWGDVRSLRVRYRGGPEVEFGLARPAWATLPLDAGKRRIVDGGLRILLDRSGLLTGLPPGAPEAPAQEAGMC